MQLEEVECNSGSECCRFLVCLLLLKDVTVLLGVFFPSYSLGFF